MNVDSPLSVPSLLASLTCPDFALLYVSSLPNSVLERKVDEMGRLGAVVERMINGVMKNDRHLKILVLINSSNTN